MSDVVLVGITIINLIILGLSLKLYTEYFKAENQRKRKE
jgi:hypothetical protein